MLQWIFLPQSNFFYCFVTFEMSAKSVPLRISWCNLFCFNFSAEIFLTFLAACGSRLRLVVLLYLIESEFSYVLCISV